MTKFKVGDKVEVLEQGSSNNPKGSIGIITEVRDQNSMRVKVEDFTDDDLVNWHSSDQLQLV